jgi:integrase
MPRKGENIYQRKDGRWEGRYVRGRKENGKPRYGYVYGQKHGEVKGKLLPFKLKHSENGRRPSPPHGLLCDRLAAWLASVSESVRPSTLASYRRVARNHILPALGDKPVEHLDRKAVEAFAESLKAKNLGGGTRRNILRLLLCVLRQSPDAEEYRGFGLPRSDKKKVPVLSRTEQDRLERAALRDDKDAAVTLALYTGLRLGEICALRWEDVDLEEGVLHIRRTLQRLENGDGTPGTSPRLGPPKTLSSQRDVPVPDKLLAYLKEWNARSESEYVISCKGHFAEPRVIQYRFHALLERAGLTRINFHALRHTFAVRCMELHMDVTTLSQLLGHASVKLTLDVYTDSLMEHKKREVRALDGLCLRNAG